MECWHHFDPDYAPDKRLVAAATHSYGVNSNWYSDTGATDHITGELDKLALHDRYTGSDQIKTVNGAGMDIFIALVHQ